MEDVKVTFKERVLQEAIKRQLALIADFRERIDDLMANDGNVNEEEYDLQSQSFMHESTAKVNMVNEQLLFANEELTLLYRLEPTINIPSGTVQFGALVKTNRGDFFVSASIEKFTVDGHPIFGLSKLSPLFQAMRGLTVGDTFEFNTIQYRILDVN